MAHDVFISYSSEDKAVADAVCATLESRKIRCWIAPRDVLPGVPYAEALIEAINGSRLMVLVFSEHSNQSQAVMREVERAVSKGMAIIPFRIKDVTPTKAMEYYLATPHWLDAMTPPMEKHLQKLVDTVEILLGTQTYPKTAMEAAGVKWGAKGRIKMIYAMVGIVVVLAAAFGLMQAMGVFKGGGDKDLNSSTPIAGKTQTITPGITTMANTPGGSTGQTATPLASTTSNIKATTTSTTSSAPLTAATGVINTGSDLISGASTTGTLGKGETKWYYFNADAGDAVYAVLSEGDGTDMQPWLELLGPDGNVITGSYGSFEYTIDAAVSKTGKHTLRVRDHSNTGGNYVLSFMQLSKAVNPMTSGVSIQEQLKIPGEVHWYTFDMSPGDAVYAVLSEGVTSSGMQPWLELLGPDGKEITGSYGSFEYTIDAAATKTGKHTLRVRDYSNKGGAYVISFMQVTKAVNPLTSGISFQGKLVAPGDINWYTFDATIGDAIFAVLTEGDGTDMQPWLELLGPDGNVITGSYGSFEYTIDAAVSKTGKHTLRVRDHSNTGGNYVLSFMQLSKAVNPMTSGVSLQGQLKIPGEVHWYTFDAAVGDAVNVVLSEGANSSSMQPWLELLGPDGKEITGSYSSVTYTIDRAITKAGKHTFRVRDYSNKGGNYVLSFNLMKK